MAGRDGDLDRSADLLRDSLASARAIGAASFGLRSALQFAGLPGDAAFHSEGRRVLARALSDMGDGAGTSDQVQGRTLLATFRTA